MTTQNKSKKEFLLEELANAKSKLDSLKSSGTATPNELNNAEYAYAMKLGVIHDIEGMSN